jgi:hypothetical protein
MAMIRKLSFTKRLESYIRSELQNMLIIQKWLYQARKEVLL